MVWAPATVEEKVYVADPFVSVRDGVCVVPSTAMVSVPVGVVVLEVDAEATVMLMASLAPTAGVLVAAESVVFEGTGGGWTTLIETVPEIGRASCRERVTLRVMAAEP